ncbi:lysozyme [Qipengyuania atrilutea]|uniref:Lysozyme n=1 Tax=Qipengyuania atrilutea TaxID=2744473 RepID=A0A850H4Q7_9SPHN|nr:lysozyme [Actirhodobacter atriluteus]NVD45487.1 lysozyme [Actirhodobacter atriluteus]
MQKKHLFDVVRRIIGRGFRQSEVAALDSAIDAMTGDDSRNSEEDDNRHLNPISRIGPEGIALIKRFEGCAKLRTDGLVEAYPDPATGAAPWTIGWGATGPGIGPGTVWTQAECDARLETDLTKYSAEVAEALGQTRCPQHQFDALVSFHYNTGAIARATLTRKHIAGDHEGATAEFARWNMAAGRVLRGLTRRRTCEAALYRGNLS